MIRKPMLAVNYIESKVVFPCIVQPKLDGVRGWNPEGNLLARSLKPHRNKHTTRFFSEPRYAGLDGELAAAADTDPLLCTKTTSATSTILGEPFLLWHCFDYVIRQTDTLPYIERYAALRDVVNHIGGHLRLVPSFEVFTLSQLRERDEEFLLLGYEGTIIRDPQGKHKQGRSTVREGGLLRIKHFIEEEAVVVGITQGNRNDNEAQINETGKQFRSSHQDNMVPNGRVGSLQCKILKSSEFFAAGREITVSPGTMTEAECIYFWEQPELIVGHIIKFKYFPKGIKDKPRFPIYQSKRSPEDIGSN